LKTNGRKPKNAAFWLFMNKVIWLTGLSGAGKTTIAHALIEKLKEKKISPILLDGDAVRALVQQMGFDAESRKKHNLQIGKWAAFLEAQGHWVVVSMISPYNDIRQEVRAMCQNFVEVYVSTPLNVCQQRDPKGLYDKAIKGEIQEFTGISAPYFPPQNAEIELDASKMTVEECVNLLIERIY
jgi:adenylylsulfate kinase